MKSFITPAYTFTPGASGVGTVNLSGISSFDIKRLVSIINQTRGAIIYATGSASLKYSSVSGSTVTLFVDTSAMSSADVLQVIYEDVVTAQPVSAVSLPLPAGAATEATLANAATAAKQDLALTQLTALNAVTLSGTGTGASANADFFPSTDVSAYKSFQFQMTTGFVGTLRPQVSNDNVNWIDCPASSSSISILPTAAINGATTSLMYNVPIVGKYFRLRIITYTSGSGAVAWQLSKQSINDYFTQYVAFSGAQLVTSTSSSVAGTISSAQITVGTTAVRATVAGTAPNAARKLLLIKPSTANTGRIWIGPSTVTTANGLEVVGPDRVEFDFDAGDYYLISDTAAQSVDVIEKV